MQYGGSMNASKKGACMKDLSKVCVLAKKKNGVLGWAGTRTLNAQGARVAGLVVLRMP